MPVYINGKKYYKRGDKLPAGWSVGYRKSAVHLARCSMIARVVCGRNTKSPEKYADKLVAAEFIEGDAVSVFLISIQGEWKPGLSLDRIDNDGHYEPGNLRWTSMRHQVANQGIYSSNTSGTKGVSWSTLHNKWRVQLQINCTKNIAKKIHLGLYEDKQDAIARREEVFTEYQNVLDSGGDIRAFINKHRKRKKI